jgi:hypothetical protein
MVVGIYAEWVVRVILRRKGGSIHLCFDTTLVQVSRGKNLDHPRERVFVGGNPVTTFRQPRAIRAPLLRTNRATLGAITLANAMKFHSRLWPGIVWLPLIYSCASNSSHTREPSGDSVRMHGGVPSEMPFSTPSEQASSGFFCIDVRLPREISEGGECFRREERCEAAARHNAESLRLRVPDSPCQAAPHAHCFELESRYGGGVVEVCFVSPAVCAEHHATETHDDHLARITATCIER